MIVYIVGFTISIFLIYYAESKRFVGLGSKVCTFLALMIPCMIAGLRAQSIGTDVRVYAQPLFETACLSEGFWNFYTAEFYQTSKNKFFFVYEFEVGFDILCYVCAQFFNSFPILLFAIQALTIIPIYKGLRAFSSSQPVWLGMTVYYLMFFNHTLNMMRQWIAMAFLFFGFQFIVNKQYRKYFLTLIIAALFHNSAIIGIVVLVVYHILNYKQTHNRIFKIILLLSIGVCSLLGLEVFARLLRFWGLRYENYISGSLSLMPNQIFYRIPLLLLLLWRWKYLKKLDDRASFYLVMLSYDLMTSQLISIFQQSGRIGVYFSEYYMLAYPAICKSSRSADNRRVMRIITLCYLVVYWWYIYVFRNSAETVPYISIFA